MGRVLRGVPAQVKSLSQPHLTESFRQFHIDQLVADIKESSCRVSDVRFDAEENANIPTVSYEVRLPAVCCAAGSKTGSYVWELINDTFQIRQSGANKTSHVYTYDVICEESRPATGRIRQAVGCGLV